MKILDMEQGSPEWMAARLGIPTASAFAKLVTPTGKPSAQLTGYCFQLVAEIMLNRQVKHIETVHTLHGKATEDAARAWYTFQTGTPVAQVGFILREDGQVGCSPDGITPSGGLEIKCPSPTVHLSYWHAAALPADYRPQVQGCMWLCETDHWDFLSFHPELPPLLLTVQRDECYIQTLADQVEKLIEMKGEMLETLLPMAA